MRALLLGCLVGLTAAGASYAQSSSVCYNGGTTGAFAASCSGSTALTYNGGTAGGSASNTGSEIQLTNGTAFDYGSVATANQFALGTDFSTSFNFQINTFSGSTQPANGFAFVLSTAPNSDGQSNGNLGIGTGANTSVALEFGTYGNPNTNPLYTTTAQGKNVYLSNFVGVIEDGNTNFQTAQNTNYGVVYGKSSNPLFGTIPGAGNNPGECISGANFSNSRAGCMSNGDIWNVSITLINNLLTVVLHDQTASASGINTTPISLTYNVAGYLGTGNVYLGFASSGGASYEQVNILGWEAQSNGGPVPEPASVAALGIGLVGLGLVRQRKAKAA